jgi:hypothetical protein
MEAAAKSIESLVSSYLPTRPHYLSISPTTRYQQHPSDTRLEEEAIRPLQYTTFLHDVDRGILLTRPYFDIRKDPDPSPEDNAPSSPKPRADPNKTVTKLSLKDYKNRKKETTPPAGNSPKKSAAPQTKPDAPRENGKEKVAPPKKETDLTAADDMQRKFGVKKAHPTLPPKPEVRRPRSPSPDRRKRPSDVDEDRPLKRSKVEGTTPNATPRVPTKPDTSIKVEKHGLHDKKPSKELKPSPMPNGRSALGNSTNRGASPRPSSQVNGSQKSVNSNHSTPKKEKPEPGLNSKVPTLLSPLGLEELKDVKDIKDEPRPSPLKKPIKTENPRSKSRDERPRDSVEPASTPKKARLRIPELLSPTLPPIVREEQAIQKKLNPSRESSQKSVKAPIKEDTIHVDSKKEKEEEPPSMIVRLKYPKRTSFVKTLTRLLALPGSKKKPEAARKEERVEYERSDSLEPGSAATARKRPRAATDATEQPSAIKRPRASDIAQPATPSKNTTAMQRVLSSSSQAGTPGVTNGQTPAVPSSSDRRQTPIDPEKAEKAKEHWNQLTALIKAGTRLKHKRDDIMKPKDGSTVNPSSISNRERKYAMAAGIQSTLAYMVGFKEMDDVRDAERKQRDPQNWRSLVPVLRIYGHDCGNSKGLLALMLRLHTISLGWYNKALCSYGSDNARAAREMFQVMKEQEQTWKLARTARMSLGVFDGSRDGEDGGPVAKLIDRLIPGSTLQEVMFVTLEILRQSIDFEDRRFTPEPELSQYLKSPANSA